MNFRCKVGFFTLNEKHSCLLLKAHNFDENAELPSPIVILKRFSPLLVEKNAEMFVLVWGNAGMSICLEKVGINKACLEKVGRNNACLEKKGAPFFS